MTPCLLALDTATDSLAAGLLTPAGVWCHHAAGGAEASSRLIPALLGLLGQAGLPASALQAIAFGQGPGAFTGLRTACAVAQGLAFGLGLPVLPIDSLLLHAEDARLQAAAAETDAETNAEADAEADADTGSGAAPAADWWVVMDARMQEVYAAHYHFDGSTWQVIAPPQLWTLAALAEVWLASPPQQVAGNASSVFAAQLPWGNATCWPHCHNRAAALLRLAESAWHSGAAIPADQALPLYLRDKVAQTTAERLVDKQAKVAAAVAGVASTSANP